MGVKSVVLVLVLALIGCLALPAMGVIPLGPKNIVDQSFPKENMSGNEIYTEVRGGVYTDAENESVLSFYNESLFWTRADTGTSLPIPKGVRTPPVAILGLGPAPSAGVWSFTLTDTMTKYLNLNLQQFGDAVSGTGELIVNGIRTPVTVGGTVLADRLSMYVIPAGSQSVYRLSLIIRPGSMDGSYVLSGPGIEQPGVAFGSYVAPQTTTTAATQTQQTQTAASQQAQLPQVGAQQTTQGY
jgi:hypothetical protein